MKSKPPVTVFWFRRDLRLQDNHGFYEALNSGENVLPLFIFDKSILNRLSDRKDKRLNFIHSTLYDLNEKLKLVGSSLLVLHDEPLGAFETICKSYEVKLVVANHDYESYAIERDISIKKWLLKSNVEFNTFKDQVIFEKNEILKSDGKPYTIFTPYSKIWKQKFSSEKIKSFPSQSLLGNLYKTKAFHFPDLKELGFKKVELNLPPLSINQQIILKYDLSRNFPALDGTSKLSVHLRFGTVSIRQLATIAKTLNETWLNELIWRDFFMMILYQFPHAENNCFKRKYEHIQWRNNESEFEKWCRGETGYPLVDAGMRELNETGFMHNRVRMVVAGFLTKHLLIDWRWGEAYFADKLLDYELASNNGNWQWSAGCGCDSAPYFRIFNPSEQAKKFDPENIYIKKWIKNYAPNYLPEIVEHSFARKRALEVFKKSLNSQIV